MQIVGVVDPDNAGGTGKMRLYLNGQRIGNNAEFKYWQDGNNDAGLGGVDSALGAAGSAGDFDGQIAIVRLYSDAKTDAEVAALYNAVVPEPATVGLLVLGGGVLLARRRRRA